MTRRRVFEKFKKGSSTGPRSGAGPRRPAQARKPGQKAPGGARTGRREPENLFEPAAKAPTPHEIACPNCGEPMLSGWGTTCGNCRPNLVAPKTLYLAPGQLASQSQQGGEGLILGWLVVVSSVDTKRQGTLIELDQPTTVLSRGDQRQPGPPGLFEFEDIFMSSGHAQVTRPRSGSRKAAFEIRDRDSTPSANGTFVNSRRLQPGEIVSLADGDIIKVGTTEIVFKSLWLPGITAPLS
ncbi:MAG TPA: FHA domain-containing protein [Polyangia bacterium]|nr:FHA domain-containing protein [Polyangia bacterium]